MIMTEPTLTSEKSKKINAISKQAIHQICSGQSPLRKLNGLKNKNSINISVTFSNENICDTEKFCDLSQYNLFHEIQLNKILNSCFKVVLDLATAVKELLENSLDSGATLVDIKLKDYGKTCISISDNGCGVLEEDFEGLGLKHHTSKLRDFSDLTEVCTFGFRGEALSSLCSLAELSIVTRHSTSEHAFKLEFDHDGVLQKKEPCAREVGTTVHVKNIFKCLPVRAKEFQRNLKKEYTKTIQVLYSYCLVAVETKITCSNMVSGKSPNVIVSTANSSNILNNINIVFGKKSTNGLIKLDLLFPDEATLQEYSLPINIVVDFEWDCYISNCDHNIGRSAPDRQFFYINSRPCDLTKVNKLINQTYHKYNNKQYPFIFLNLKLNKETTDINVTPNKRTIFCTQEHLILATLKFSLISQWDKLQGVLNLKPVTALNFSKKRSVSPTNDNPPLKRFQNYNVSNAEHTEKKNMPCDKESEITQYVSDIVNNDMTDQIRKLDDVEMPISILTIKQRVQEKGNAIHKHFATSTTIKFKAQIESNQSSAEKELKKQLTKESFLQMEIIGQFNLGFIIARLEGDLFIIDQHATDEKYRFEKLNNETRLKTQKLIVPKTLNISSLNETILIEHKETFQQNGFFFNINSEAESGQRVQLTCIPVSGYWQFGQEDIEELIFLIREGGIKSKENSIYRPSRVRQMLASRACRSAVMIGTALNDNDMQKLIAQMAQMENPWSCPHGRPTIRHLLSLNLIHK